MKKRIISILLVIFILLSSIGCGNAQSNTDNSEPEEIVPTGIMVPVAEYEPVKFSLNDYNVPYVWTGDEFVYMKREWDKTAEINICDLYRISAEGVSEPVHFYQSTLEGPSIWCFTMDREENIYTLSWIPSGNDRIWILYRYDSEMNELQSCELTDLGFSAGTLNHARDIYVDSEGNIILKDDYNSEVYLFDKDFKFLGKDSIKIYTQEERFLDAGAAGSFFWNWDWNTNEIQLQKVDFESGRMGEIQTVRVDEYIGENENRVLLSGYDKGIFISSNSSLLQYDAVSGEVTKVLDWRDDYVNVDGSQVKQILFTEQSHSEDVVVQPETDAKSAESLMKDSESAMVLEGMSALLHDRSSGSAEMVTISYVDKAYVPEIQVIQLATMNTWAAEYWVNSFNRSSKNYKVEILECEDMTELIEKLMFKQGDIPDILDLSFISVDMLNSKGLLTDLKPYFEQSELAKQEDILEQIWDACLYDDKLVSMITSFSFGTYETSARDIPTDGWTYEEFFALEDKYPESKPLLYYNYMPIWNMLATSGASEFIDWEKKTSHYDSEEFCRLIEQIKDLDKISAESKFYQEEEEISKMLDKEFLLRQTYYSSPYWYRRVQNKYGRRTVNVGYPTADGTPYYLILPQMEFSIYNESENKDGAWAFIEYVLSEEGQSWYGSEVYGFPVRKDAFETFLTLPQSPLGTNYADDNRSIDSATPIKHMLEYAHRAENRGSGEITTIVYEELQAFFADAKTAQETAKIIDNRVQLYLDENF